jgi:hypothetical protein
MFVNALTKDNWKGARDTPEQIKSPSWNDIETAIRALDGGRRTVVVLEGERAHLTVGGGSEGRYMVCATVDSAELLTLSLSNEGHSKVTLHVGGQDGEYQDNFVVDTATVMMVAKIFAESGRLDSTVLWLPPMARRRDL